MWAWPPAAWASRLYDWANFALVLGLVVGVVATALIVWMGKVKENYSNHELAATNERAARAEQRAADANAKAEAEQLARVRIEEKLAGWTLDGPAQARVIEKLKPFKGTPFDLGANPKEVVFMETLDGMLGASGWVRKRPQQAPGAVFQLLLDGKARFNYVSGMYIEIALSRIGVWGPAMKALADALDAEGIPTRPQTSEKELDDSAMHIIIGSK
ncbi:MAG: hypothetical protein WBC67_17835 [Candidatus Acidiferrales bacterium]